MLLIARVEAIKELDGGGRVTSTSPTLLRRVHRSDELAQDGAHRCVHAVCCCIVHGVPSTVTKSFCRFGAAEAAAARRTVLRELSACANVNVPQPLGYHVYEATSRPSVKKRPVYFSP